ncbi:hypothetical protein C8R43DRAFT_1126336 [Mycena crocata]|nr:hypothetical protein C8R43DRAFT_1126336 [Mycena crocata]
MISGRIRYLGVRGRAYGQMREPESWVALYSTTTLYIFDDQPLYSMSRAILEPDGSQVHPWIVAESPPVGDQNPLALGGKKLDSVLNRISELELDIVAGPVPGPSRHYKKRTDSENRLARSLDIRELRHGPLPPATIPRNPLMMHGPIRNPSMMPGTRRTGPNALAVKGWRLSRATPLTHEDLWVDGVGPQVQLPKEPHHKCGICRHVKSHPVTNFCGHSYCYVCIRLWFEHEFTCPECMTVVWLAPMRQFAEEAYLRSAYPEWHQADLSKVRYKWIDLVLPGRPKLPLD